MSMFSDLAEEVMEIFMDDFTVYESSFKQCLQNLGTVLQRCQDKNLALNWEKCHFMVTKGIVLGHIISAVGMGSGPSKSFHHKDSFATYNNQGNKKLLGTCWFL